MEGKTDIAAQRAEAAPSRRSAARLPRKQRASEIQAAARVVFRRRGYAEASIAEIAAEAGVAEGTIYKVFESKRHLVLRVIEAWYESMLADFTSNLDGVRGTRNKIRFIVWHLLKSLKENPDIARLCANEVRNDGDYYQSELHELNRRYTHVFMEVCRQGVASGELRADTPIALVRDLIFGGINHHMSGVLYGRGDIDVDRSADLIVELVFSGTHVPERGAEREQEVIERMEKVVQRLESIGRRISGFVDAVSDKRNA